MNISALENTAWHIFTIFAVITKYAVSEYENILVVSLIIIHIFLICCFSLISPLCALVLRKFHEKGTFIDYALSIIYHAISRKVC